VSTVVEKLKKGHEERFVGSGRVRLDDAPEGKVGRRTFSGVAYSGAPVQRSFGPMVIDLQGIEHADRTGMLTEHDDDRPVGVANKFEVTRHGLELGGYLLDDKASGGHSSKLVAMAEQGWPLKMSIGVRFISHRLVEAGDTVVVNGRKLEGPIVVVDRCWLFETSFIHCSPADLDTSATIMRARMLAKLTDERYAQLKRASRRAKHRPIRHRQTLWLNRAALVLADVFHDAGLHPVPGKIRAAKLPSRLQHAAGVTRWESERPTVVVDPTKQQHTSEFVETLIHELLHCALGHERSHDHPEWKLYLHAVGLRADGGLNDEGIATACKVIRECGEWPGR
jgi:hypothetical protein